MAEHNILTDPYIHEPKGISTASNNQYYVSDGAGGGTWTTIPAPYEFEPQYEELIEGSSLINQNPTGLGDANAITVSFGDAQTSAQVSCDATGILTFHEEGMYRIKLGVEFGRTGGAGVAELMMRGLINGTQVGHSIYQKIGDSDIAARYDSEEWFFLPAGTTASFEIKRMTGSNNSGGLVTTNDPEASWNPSPSAFYKIGRLVA